MNSQTIWKLNTTEPLVVPQTTNTHINTSTREKTHKRCILVNANTFWVSRDNEKKEMFGWPPHLGEITVQPMQMHYLRHPHDTPNTLNSTAMRVIPYKPHSHAFTVCLTG